jgi:hypothetical protein
MTKLNIDGANPGVIREFRIGEHHDYYDWLKEE